MTRRYEIHFMAINESQEHLTSKDLSKMLEDVLVSRGITPEMSQVKSTEGHDDSFVFVGTKRVPLHTLISAYLSTQQTEKGV